MKLKKAGALGLSCVIALGSIHLEAVHNACRQPLSYIKIIFLYTISSAVALILFILLTHSI